MSDIRFNRWLHQSGTGGVSQDSSGNIGIGTTVPTKALDVVGDVKIGDTISIENTSGIITATTFSGVSADFSGNVSIAGTLTYEDVTNIDSVGVVTARSDVHIGAGLSVVGVSTLGNTIVGGATTELIVGGDARITGILTIGTSSLTLDGTNNLITVGSGVTINGNTGIISATGGLNAKLLGTPELAAIDSSITDTAVDIFVYDTRKDSDGGAWRKRTQHTSWYNETLNTATRGSRREFLAVAVIVATTDKVSIYDGDDPDLPMWMVFNEAVGRILYTNANCVSMLNGQLMIGTYPNASDYWDGGVKSINFISEYIRSYSFGRSLIYSQNISERNGTKVAVSDTVAILVNPNVNDVAMTVLPNAPIDPATGLPIPTIAVATDSGVSVIRDDGTVVDVTAQSGGSYNDTAWIDITKNNHLIFEQDSSNRAVFCIPIPSADRITATNDGSITDKVVMKYYSSGTHIPYPCYFGAGIYDGISLGEGDNQALVGGNGELTILHPNFDAPEQGKVAYATTSYNTGWMHGDIKGAFLSGISTASVTGTELVTNGTFDSNSTGWTLNSGASGSVSNGQFTITSPAAAWSGAYTSITTEIGKTYVVTADIVSSNNWWHFSITDGTPPDPTPVGPYAADYLATNFKVFLTFTATATTHYISVGNLTTTNATVTTIDNVSVRLADPDRSVNNKGLQVFGTVNKTAVATGAELVAYSGFSASNGLIQPYNSDMEFGTGDYYMSIWAYGGGDGQVLMIREHGTADNDGTILLFQQSNSYAFYSRQNGTSSWTYTLSSTGYGSRWNHVMMVRTGGIIYGYVNGNLETQTTFSGDVSNNDATLNIGKRNPNVETQYFTGSLALAKIGAGAPSPEQIKKIYEDEKFLFQENAACTLYGSSDAVTALAYDEVNDLLHVGTSSGRSDFNGLRRINNTTTAVTTAISAYDGLIAAQ